MPDIRVTLQFISNGKSGFGTAHYPVPVGADIDKFTSDLVEEHAPDEDEEWYTFKQPGTNGYDGKIMLVRTDDITDITFKPVEDRRG